MSLSERELLQTIWQSGVDEVSGYQSVKNALGRNGEIQPTHMIAVGKAASAMARAAIDRLGSELKSLVVTKYDHTEDQLKDLANCTVIESAHPVPDDNSLMAGKALIDFVDGLDSDSRLLALVSGGASSLAEALPNDFSLQKLQSVTGDMLAQGLDIHAINTRRKEISQIKGGKLLARFIGAQAWVMAISDVEGDELGVIGSGIGDVSPDRKCENMNAEIIASNEIARLACQKRADQLGESVVANDESLYGDVFDIATQRAAQIVAGPKGLYLFGGEPVIELPKTPGEGGRNQALALAMARELSSEQDISVMVAGTDGSDGPTGSAGGFISSTDWNNIEGGEDALKSANSGSWLRKSGGLVVTGPTGTNVMDLMIAIKR